MACLCSLLSQISLLHVQLEWVTCTQVSTLLLREDALGLQLVTTISTHVSECLKSTLLLREDASGPQLAAALADRTCRCDLPQT